MLKVPSIDGNAKADRTNAIIAGLVYVVALIVYAMTVQRSLSFWDCGEFIACSYILGIPHPPGSPLFVMMGRLFTLLPIAADISHRVNLLTVLSSSFTTMFSYLLTKRLIDYLSGEKRHELANRIISYVGGVCGGFFVAWSRTNWGNSVEAEVYGLAMALSVLVFYLGLIYFDHRGTAKGTRIMVLVYFLAAIGIGVHMTVYLIVPISAIFFILKKDSAPRDYMLVSAWAIVELAMILLFSDGRGGVTVFYLASALLGASLIIFLYKKIDWPVLIATGAVSAVMVSFSDYFKLLPISFGIMIILAFLSKKYRWNLDWKAGMAILFIFFVGLSVHAYIPIRSADNPRIDENNPSRDWETFVDFLDRKQYGQMNMVDRMFHRRGLWENQFGRHAHMGYWSFFEDQYSKGHTNFLPILALGLIGLGAMIRRRQEIGMPLLTLILICSVGLILYMNFADGTQYDFRTTDAYLEVRDRDYFFTPAFVFFGVALGLGVGAIVKYLADRLGRNKPSMRQTVAFASIILVFLPTIALAHNFHYNDRSKNFIPYNYACNLLDSCDKNAIFFTSGDNDTFPVWCVQEVYNYRKDVRVVNLSLLNTDWYIEQMKTRYDVPINLTKDQIIWHDYEVRPGIWTRRPSEQFNDRPRRRMTYLQAGPYNGRVVKVQDMMTDEIVLDNRWKDPIYFSSSPYGESPLNLRSRAVTKGLVEELMSEQPKDNDLIDVDDGYNLYMNTYRFGGYENSDVYRDENATGIYIGVGVGAIRIMDKLRQMGDTTRLLALGNKMLEVYPEYWQTYVVLAEHYDRVGDSARSLQIFQMLNDTLTSFYASNPENLFYEQDLGLAKIEIGKRIKNDTLVEAGVDYLWDSFAANPNSNYSFRKLVASLSQLGRYQEIQKAAHMFAQYKINLQDPFLQQILGISAPPEPITPPITQ